MHEEPETPWRMPCMILSVSCCFLAVLVAYYSGDARLVRQQAVQRGYAEYNRTTGQWQWKEKAE